MNKKKMIFIAILAVIAFIVLIIAIVISTSTKSAEPTEASGDFKIWILDDSKDDFMSFIEDYKKDSGNTNVNIIVESFDSYEEYNFALSSSIIKGEAPDLYMLNNNEKSIFLENAIGINPEIISPDEMRESFRPFFGDDLVIVNGEGDTMNEFVVGVPFGFETLGMYFNLRLVGDVKKIKSFSNIANFINEFHSKKPSLVALGIGRGETVKSSGDIFAQFLLSDNVKSIGEVNSSNTKVVFSEYFEYASGNNNYSKFDTILQKSGKTNLDYFIDGEIAMIFGYPRMLLDINEKGFSKSLLQVINFPDFINDSNKLVNYNYFVLNKNSTNIQLANSLLKYIFSEKGEKAYLSHFKYYMPARVSLYSELKERNINDSFHIKLKNFYNQEAIYSSFDKGLKSIYDKNILALIDDEVNYLNRALKFFDSLMCKTNKVIRLDNLSDSCD